MNLSLHEQLAAIDKQLKIIDAMEMADYRAYREDQNYDPYGEGANRLFDKKIKLMGERQRVATLMKPALSSMNG